MYNGHPTQCAMNLMKLNCHGAVALGKRCASRFNVCAHRPIVVFSVLKYFTLIQDSELTAILNDVEQLWTSFRSDAAYHSTPLLYISSLVTMLATSTVQSLTLARWQAYFPELPAMKCKGVHQPRTSSTVQANNAIYSAVFLHDSTLIVFGLGDGTVRMWETGSGEEIIPMSTSHTDSVTSVAISHDGTYVVSSSSDSAVRIWETEIYQWVTSVAFSPDSTHIAFGSNKGTLLISRTESGEEVARMIGRGNQFYRILP